MYIAKSNWCFPGGYNGAERLNDMHEYSFATSLWTELDVSVGDVVH